VTFRERNFAVKVKLKLDKNAIKNFFIDHAEKVIFGFVLLGVMMIVYSSVAGREKTDKAPKDLQDKVAAADAKIKQTTVAEKSDLQLDEIAELNQVAIKTTGYELTKPISPPVGKLEHPRGEPKILGVEKLKVAAGTGMFQIAVVAKAPAGERGGQAQPAAAAADMKGQRWAVITGLVPWKKQCDLYRDTFADCKQIDPLKDQIPEYKGYWVERLEITSPADITNPNWNDAKKVTKFQSNVVETSVTKDWGLVGQLDPVDPRFLNRNLSFPLGPLTEGTWDASVAHEPEIPIVSNNMYGGAPAPAEDAAPEKKPDTDSFEDRTAATAAGGAMGGMPVMPVVGGYGNRGAIVPGGMAMDANGVEYYLFRFFDFTVEPGKRYIYRVQLALSNPNFGVKSVYLEKPEFGQKKILTNAKDSKLENSPVVSIPNDTSSLAIAVEQPKRLINDPLGSMLLALWKQDTGQKVYNEFAVERGQLLNFADAEVKAVQSRVGIQNAAPDKTSLLSNVLVVDMAGGKKLPTTKPKPPPEELTDQFSKKIPGKDKDRACFSPGEILIMEPDGRLVVRDEYDDMASVEKYAASPDQSMPVGMPPGGMRVPGGMPPGYGPAVGMPPGYGPAGGMPPGYGPAVGMPPGYGPAGGMPPGYGPPATNRGGAAGAMPDLFRKPAGKKP
jgi:hypothetical protein